MRKQEDLGVGNLAISDRSGLDRAVAGLTDSIAGGPFRPLLRDWNRLRRDGDLPLRFDFDPETVADWLSYLSILEAVDEGRDFRYRLTGTRVDAYLGQNLTGRRVSDITFQKSGNEFWTLLRSCFDGQAPVAGTIRYVGARNLIHDCTALMLPWRTAADSPGQIMIVQDFRSVEMDQD